ncbi:hypothetical protein WICPIJ_009416 [Wickerhamomyces pijperi]|uniref:Uncharacterized protein n=1 Tax=Wickerhamomyces pijperi TaxID=599730 RepID=A0A9P8TDC6_WICPI|nr:hypothetical protein WICPIJ_009416 [Wickerhamomyces pijperi]
MSDSELNHQGAECPRVGIGTDPLSVIDPVLTAEEDAVSGVPDPPTRSLESNETPVQETFNRLDSQPPSLRSSVSVSDKNVLTEEDAVSGVPDPPIRSFNRLDSQPPSSSSSVSVLDKDVLTASDFGNLKFKNFESINILPRKEGETGVLSEFDNPVLKLNGGSGYLSNDDLKQIASLLVRTIGVKPSPGDPDYSSDLHFTPLLSDSGKLLMKPRSTFGYEKVKKLEWFDYLAKAVPILRDKVHRSTRQEYVRWLLTDYKTIFKFYKDGKEKGPPRKTEGSNRKKRKKDSLYALALKKTNGHSMLMMELIELQVKCVVLSILKPPLRIQQTYLRSLQKIQRYADEYPKEFKDFVESKANDPSLKSLVQSKDIMRICGKIWDKHPHVKEAFDSFYTNVESKDRKKRIFNGFTGYIKSPSRKNSNHSNTHTE